MATVDINNLLGMRAAFAAWRVVLHQDLLAGCLIGCYRWRMIDRPKPWNLPELDAYLEATLRQMARNRDVKSDKRGEPVYAPLAVIAGQGDHLAWFLGDAPITTTSNRQTPEQAGDAIGMDQLLAAHRAWVGRSGRSRGR